MLVLGKFFQICASRVDKPGENIDPHCGISNSRFEEARCVSSNSSHLLCSRKTSLRLSVLVERKEFPSQKMNFQTAMVLMATSTTLAVVLLPTFIISAAVGDEVHGHARVMHGKDLSDKEHFGENGEHAADYDHEAFLGDELSEEFDHLTPDESIRRLALIVDKIDKDQDGYVTLDEMKAWIQYTQKRYINEDVDRQWGQHELGPDGKLSWEKYRELMYGFLDEVQPENQDREEYTGYKKMEERDRRRWELSDEDGDDFLTKTEFTNFLHPEDAEHMRDIIVLETLEDIDANGDGKVSIDEYIGDMYAENGDAESEPDWVKSEREQFETFRDKNQDGFMDLDEVRDWIIPADFDHSEAESKHLIFEADEDQDGKLTKAEILDKYDLFVGSQATDFGEALTRHDEF